MTGCAVSQGCRMGGLVHVNTSLYSAVSLTRETCTRAWVRVSQNKVTTSFLLLQQHFTYPTCSIFKANLQKGRLLKALHWICTCKADPAGSCQILEKHQCLSLKKIRGSRRERSSGIVDLCNHCCLTLILRKHITWIINWTLSAPEQWHGELQKSTRIG